MKNNKTKKKDKKKRLPLGRTLSNTGFALRQVWEVSPLYFIFYYLVTFIYAPLDFLSGSFMLRLIVDGVEGGVETSTIVTYIIIIAAISLVIGIFSNLYWNLISPPRFQRIGSNLQKKIFRKSAEVELECYEKPAFYDKYVIAFNDVHDRVMKVMQTIDNLIWRIISLACNSFLIFIIDPWLIIFALFPLVLGYLRRVQNRVKHDQSVEHKKIDRRIAYVRRTFYLNEYAKEMRIGGMYRRMFEEIRLTFRDFKAVARKYGVARAALSFLQSFGLEVVTVMGAMLYSIWRTVGDGSMTMGDCIVVLNSIGTISWCINYLIQNIAEFGEHALFIEDVRYFLDYEPKIKEDPNAPEATGGDIELSGVSFRYDGAETNALENVSMQIRAGEHIALVGQNGSGKTTLVKLLLRLYDPTEGKVILDGRDAKEYKLSSYRDNFSCVFQDFKVFSMSVKDNVLLREAREGDDELVTRALKESGAYEKIETLEDGIHTTLTREFDDKGANLSIGEQQKVSLARVFAEDAPCVILDEPSSALDPIAEHKMFENMMRAAAGRSVIFISHRLSSAVDADRIYLLEQGRITEVGSHSELMAKGGKYADMFRLQAENYVGSKGDA